MATSSDIEADTAYGVFEASHASMLDISGLPKILWRNLYEQLQQNAFLAGNHLQFAEIAAGEKKDGGADPEAPRLAAISTHDMQPNEVVFLVDHALTFTNVFDSVQAVHGHPSLLPRIAALTGACTSFDALSTARRDGSEGGGGGTWTDDLSADRAEGRSVGLRKRAAVIANILHGLLHGQQLEMYRVASGTADAERDGSQQLPETVPAFFVMDEVGCRISTSDEEGSVNMRVAPFFYLDPAAGQLVPYSIAWNTSAVAKDEILCRMKHAAVAEQLSAEFFRASKIEIDAAAEREKQFPGEAFTLVVEAALSVVYKEGDGEEDWGRKQD